MEIVPSGPADAAELRKVYTEAFREQWRDDTLPTHAARAGFKCRAAWDGDEMVGFTYGYTGDFGQWWTDHIAARVSPELSREWLGGHFELVELAVLPSHERRGLGTALHDALLDGLPHRVALLTATDDENAPARRLYDRKGWRVLAGEVFDGAVLMGLTLR
ncbi:GNAT family N-acetyltransferase [Paractinoplanes atraurantiacus]|uniref:Acetyltransferase (GNAT) family protein n=1 Tax=Paractinoplanes atraurantiacus TaxID=1036182 RepID=A0A285JT41_9ACTN|nr:GNAT family N-acetyltransferase [Actinoplanes atraurantiacus]SNY62516.1 Acetyltransferase (GNAT) family protein [Actinoplanes atraurantiacus]